LSSTDRSSGNKGPVLWPLLLAVIGVILLLSNFLLLGDFQILDLWPVLLIVLGAQVLLRGDLIPSNAFRTFGITRGIVESATLEVNSGEIDVSLRALQNRNAERLIAGQFANQARPDLHVEDVHAYLTMDRSRTPWLSFADWEMGLAPGLPWQIVMSSYLGQISVDLSQLIMQNAFISSGVGDVHLICPPESFEAIYVRSTLGNIHITTPDGYNVRVTIDSGRFLGLRINEARYEEVQAGIYQSRNHNELMPLVDLIINGTFGDIYLS